MSFRPLYGIVTTLTLAKAVTYLQYPDKSMFFTTLGFFAGFVVIYQICNGALKNGAQTYSWKAYDYLFRKYFTKYIKLDNNKTEVIGT